MQTEQYNVISGNAYFGFDAILMAAEAQFLFRPRLHVSSCVRDNSAENYLLQIIE